MLRFRYLDETIAVVLAVVAIKLLTEDPYMVPPGAEPRDRGGAVFAAGILASLLGGRPERRSAAKGQVATVMLGGMSTRLT
jgi:hypothetical protein